MWTFRTTYTDDDGKRHTTKSWYVGFTDHEGIRRRIPTGVHSREAAKAIGRAIENLVDGRRSGAPLYPEVRQWVESITPALKARLVKLGLLDDRRLNALAPLVEHLDGGTMPGFRQSLEARGVIVGLGSACNAADAAGSSVVAAMGVPAALRAGILRVSLSDETTAGDIKEFAVHFLAVATGAACLSAEYLGGSAARASKW